MKAVQEENKNKKKSKIVVKKAYREYVWTYKNILNSSPHTRNNMPFKVTKKKKNETRIDRNTRRPTKKIL